MKSLVLLAFLLAVSAHPTFYNVDRNETCYKEKPAEIYSWHVHILYWNKNPIHTKGALELRDRFAELFAKRLGDECTDLFHQDQLCLFEPDWEAVGPFATAQWSVFLTPEDFNDIVPWFLQNRNGYDLLVHPNTGCELEDHSWWALWAGTAWQIDMSAFSHDRPFPWPEESRHPTYLRRITKESVVSDLVKKFLEEHENDQ